MAPTSLVVPRWTRLLLGIILCLTLGLAGCSKSSEPKASDDDDPSAAGQAFLTAWGEEDATAAAAFTTNPEAAEETLAGTIKSLDATVDTTAGPVTKKNGTGQSLGSYGTVTARATMRFQVTYHLTDLGDWSYQNEMPLVKTSNKGWLVAWSPSVIYKRLTADNKLMLGAAEKVSAKIEDRNGTSMVSTRKAVSISIRPDKLTDETLAYQVLDKLGVDIDQAKKDVKAADPTETLPQIVVNESDFAPYADRANQAGLVTATTEKSMSESPTFAKAILNDIAGSRQASKESGGGSIILAPKDEAKAKSAVTVFEFPAKNNVTIKTTLDLPTQRAAEAALDTVKGKKAAALVALDTRTNGILAVANRGAGGTANTTFDRALTGTYPPGSTFKIVTTTAFLADGLAVNDTVDCPKVLTIEGHDFSNAHNQALGAVPFSTDFAQSCNTAFAGQSKKLERSSITNASKKFGLGEDWSLGVPTFSGKVPVTSGDQEKAATAIGQARVVMSPLAMANVASTVASGAYQEPTLITSVSGTKDDTDNSPGRGTRQDLASAATLRTLMHSVVTTGTAKSALGSLASGTTPETMGAKTGTAEYGSKKADGSYPTHAWLVGYRNNVAFAVVVEDGGFGGEVAGPVARTFLSKLG